METIAKPLSGIMFERSKLKEFNIITSPYSKVELTVLRNVTEANAIVDPETLRKRYIVNLAAITADKIEEVKRVFADREQVPIEETNGLFLTANVWVNKDFEPELPMKGETVKCSIGYVMNQDKTQAVLRVIGMQLKPAQRAEFVNLETFFTAEAQSEHIIEFGEAN